MFTKKKISLVTFLLFSDILFASHFFLLKGGLTGASTILVDVIYLIIMYLLERYNKTKYNIYVSLLAIITTIILSIVTWESAISLLPMFSMLTYFTTMIFKNLIIVKSGALIRNTLNVIYMFLIASYLGAGLEIALMLSAIIGIVINWKKKDSTLDKKITNSDVNTEDNLKTDVE